MAPDVAHTPQEEVEEIEFHLLLEAIFSRYGYDLRGYAPASLRRRVLAVLAKSGLGNLGELQHRLLSDPSLFADVLDDLTVHVSELFRDPGFFRVFRERVVPVLRTYPLVKIWHCGCGTGEEVYSSAIVLSETSLYERTQIYATDVSPGALDAAREGVYSTEQVETFAENYARAGGVGKLSDYCTDGYGRIALKEPLRKNVLFFQHDLVSDQVFGEMHVVFCRNVLIYFGHDLKSRVLAKLARSLCPGGFLCLGSSERLARPGEWGFTEFAADVSIYRR